MNKIEQVILNAVNDISSKYSGGEEFFDLLDDFLSTKLPMSAYEKLVEGADNKTIIMSGGFGKKILSLIKDGKLNVKHYMLFAGGLRKSDNPQILESTTEAYTEAIYIDDTIYGGATYVKIKEYLRTNTIINISKCRVIYDGCPVKKTDVESFFRYYDHFNVEPNFKFK